MYKLIYYFDLHIIMLLIFFQKIQVPVCKTITGKGMKNAEILGMLPCPLKLHFFDYINGVKKKFVVSLEQVLVVRGFSVPLHVSVKRLEDLFFAADTPKDMLTTFSNIFCSLPCKHECALPFESASVPPSYQQHDYWRAGQGVFFGFTNADGCKSKLFFREYF